MSTLNLAMGSILGVATFIGVKYLDEFLNWKQHLYRKLSKNLDENTIPMYELPLNASSDISTWDRLFILRRMAYYGEVEYREKFVEAMVNDDPVGNRTDISHWIQILRIGNRSINFKFDLCKEKKSWYNHVFIPMIKDHFLKTYSHVYVRRAALTLLCIQKYDKLSIGNIALTRDVTILIAKALLNTINDKCWIFNEYKMLEELDNRDVSDVNNLGNTRHITFFKIKTYKDYWYLRGMDKDKVWIDKFPYDKMFEIYDRLVENDNCTSEILEL